MTPTVKRFLMDWIPPAAQRAGGAALDVVRPAAFELAGYDWPEQPAAGGWDASGVAGARERSWQKFIGSLDSTDPMGLGPADLDRPWHLNTDVQALYTTFGYALALASRGVDRVRVLDWGGELGSYLFLARKLMPDVPFEWHCVDLPLVVELGRKLNPDVIFHDDGSWKEQRYDFVFSSSSLQYLPDWRPTLRDLADAATSWMYLTRMPFVRRSPSFVALQRVKEYSTEIHGWVLNRDAFVDAATSGGHELVQSFVNHRGPRIRGAPEQNLYMGFLFRRPARSVPGPGPSGKPLPAADPHLDPQAP
jgi:putative methyltransferase (TIGR04325 family)